MVLTESNLEKSIEKFLNSNNIPKHYLEFDENFEDFQIKIEKWLSAIDPENQEVFIFLFENLIYLTRKNLIEKLKEYYSEYKKIALNYEKTIFLPVTSYGGMFNGAINVIECFQKAMRNEISVSKKSIAIQPRDFYDEFNLEDVENVVFFDDIIGSGNTFRDFLIRTVLTTPRLLKDKNIYLISLYNLDKGMKFIEQDLNKNNGWNITVINNETITEIFKDSKVYLPGMEREVVRHKGIVKKYEKVLNKDKKKYTLGYQKSGVLLSFYYNTPNNTLSTFWKKVEDKWFPFFPREDDEDKFNLNEKNILKEMKKYRDLKQSRIEFIKEQIELEERSRVYG